MQFRLRTLFIIMAVVCVYCATLGMPALISLPVYSALAMLTPAYWITGVVYARGSRRAFFIGGLATGLGPFIGLVIVCIIMVFDGPWRWGRSYSRYDWGEAQLFNLTASLLIALPVAIAFIGGWLAFAIYHSLQHGETAWQAAEQLEEQRTS